MGNTYENTTRDDIIDSYIKTLSKVVGSEEEARMKIYFVSTKHYFAFGALVPEELSSKIKMLPEVTRVLPDSYEDVSNKSYGADFPSLPFTYSAKDWGHLGGLGLDSSACSTGTKQSPIDINKKQAAVNNDLDPLTRNYKTANATLINTGYSIGVQYESDAGSMTIGKTSYNLKQLHWHTPAEHLLNGFQYDAELHLVHTSANGSVAVVGIFFQFGDSDPFIAKIEDGLQKLAKEKCAADEEPQIALGKVDNKPLRKDTRKYYRYIGSLTTPPCTENITWNILGVVRSISKKQVDLLHAPLDESYRNNCRPVQELNERNVVLYNEDD